MTTENDDEGGPWPEDRVVSSGHRSLDTLEAMRRRSGSVAGGPIATVLYILLRDGHVSPSRLEQLLDDFCGEIPVRGQFTNGWLGAYANDIARRLVVAEARRLTPPGPPEPPASDEAEYVEKDTP